MSNTILSILIQVDNRCGQLALTREEEEKVLDFIQELKQTEEGLLLIELPDTQLERISITEHDDTLINSTVN